MARSPSERREASRKSDFVLVKKEDIPLLYTKPVVHFDFKKVVHLIEFQTIKYKEQPRAKLQKKFLKYYQNSLEINFKIIIEENLKQLI